jgi:hypothetical protein
MFWKWTNTILIMIKLNLKAQRIKIYENFSFRFKKIKTENLIKKCSSNLDECDWTNYESRFIHRWWFENEFKWQKIKS